MKELLKVCHIVNWYPNAANEKEAIWTQRHIAALNEYCKNDVFHVQVIQGKFQYQSKVISENEQSFTLSFPTKIWFVKEILTTILLCFVLLFKLKRKNYDIFNFQITYPLLTYSKLICWIVKKPIVVTEHWSAYHLNFGVKKELKRIKRIFKNKKLKFICVSQALVRDIETFSGQNIDYCLVPNVIDSKFEYLNIEKPINSFFMLSFWKYPKNPFLLLDVFAELKKEDFQFTITIGGYGPMMGEIVKKINKNSLTANVKLIGEIEGDEIIRQLNSHAYFMHNSNYEVASVVCSEALCCGTPLVVSAVGGIVEYTSHENGILVLKNDFESWYNSIKSAMSENVEFNHSKIALKAGERFHPSNVGLSYYQALSGIAENAKKCSRLIQIK